MSIPTGLSGAAKRRPRVRDDVVPGTFRFKDYEGGRVYPGENRMEILFTPDDTEAYTTAECIITVTGTKRTVTRVPDDVIITDKPIGTAFENLGLPSGVKVETNTGASYSPRSRDMGRLHL